ncbi:MAG: DoxX family protein [Crocinitomicaceae bacterium]|nr:DoxX family protein [Crocinitomicaceae bacterium]
METVILIMQIGLALLFVYFGSLKVFLPFEKIKSKVSWAEDYPVSRLRLFGFIEIIGGLGLILPHQLNIFPILTPMAATGLAMVMAGAAMVHLKRDEFANIFLNIFIIFLLAGIGFNTLLEVFHTTEI